MNIILKFVQLISILAIIIAGTAISASANSERYVFRHKFPLDYISITNPVSDNAVLAFFVGGEGLPFSKKLPLKADWGDDSWQIVSGELPDGISFDTSSRVFSGTPTVTGKFTIGLNGYDLEGNVAGQAEVHFDMRKILGAPVFVDFYGHTGKTQSSEIPLPNGVVVYEWDPIIPVPDGIRLDGRFFNGAPVEAGDFPLFGYGKNFDGDIVATYIGSFLVQDGPTFEYIADNIMPLPNPLVKNSIGPIFFGAPSPHGVRPINPDVEPRYFVEMEKGDTLPYGLFLDNSITYANFSGSLSRPYQTATFRFKAIDSDGTEGYSNWFEYGTSNPTAVCRPTHGQPVIVPVTTGIHNSIPVPRPVGAKGVLSFAVTSGTLPDGISLDPVTGVLHGTPTTMVPDEDIAITTTITNGTEIDVTEPCGFTIRTVRGDFNLVDITPEQERHLRLGEVYNGTLSVRGGIEDYTVAFEDAAAWSDYSFSSAVLNNDTVTVVGIPQSAGDYKIPFNVENGDGDTLSGNLRVYVHDNLAIDDIAGIDIQRLEGTQVWHIVGYDEATVIPDITGDTLTPRFTLSNAIALPEGISFNASGYFIGATDVAVGTFGPFTITMTDFSGETDTTPPFNITVTERAPIEISAPEAVSLYVRNPLVQMSNPIVSVIQPRLAETFTVTYTLNGPALPTELSFDSDDATIHAEEDMSFDLIDTYGPYTITATDSEGSSATSAEFFITLQTIPDPVQEFDFIINSNVSGNPGLGQSPVSVYAGNLKSYIDEKTVIGGLDAVTFTGISPASPAGLDFDAANQTISGIPNAEFNGDVTITFEDEEGREGTLTLQLTVLPYPTLSEPEVNYDLPRLMRADFLRPQIVLQADIGFWNDPTWKWADGISVPQGLFVNGSTGVIGGSTDAPVGTVFSDLQIAATSKGGNNETLVTLSAPFSITVGEPTPMTLSYEPNLHKFYLDGQTLAVQSQELALPINGGSYVEPLKYSLDLTGAPGLSGISINEDTGLITGSPTSLGKWTVNVNLADAEGTTIATPYALDIKATKSGFVEYEPVDPYAFILRQEQSFAIPGLTISNEVGNVSFSTSPVLLDSGLQFNPATGGFEVGSKINSPKEDYRVVVKATDEDERGFAEPPYYFFDVSAPLEVSISPSLRTIESRQFSIASEDVIDMEFAPNIKNDLGDISYSIVGTVPGTLVYKFNDDGTTKYSYRDGNNVLVETTNSSALPLDALTLDTETASFSGIPSQDGSFSFRLAATDSHMDKYDYPSDPTRSEYNTATITSDITLTVEEAADFEIVSASTSDNVPSYTSQPKARVVTSGAAYGHPVTWKHESGTLPTGVYPAYGSSTLGFAGYPTQTGTFSNLVFSAKDAAGREITTPALTMKVGPREPLTLVVANTVTTLAVNSLALPISVTAKNTPFGQTIPAGDWNVTGVSNLPEGMDYTINNGNVTFTGTPTIIGSYRNIIVTAKDSLNATASLNIGFDVVQPDGPITLETPETTTKIGYPFEATMTHGNTYGKVVYSTGNLGGVNSSDISLNTSTGVLNGTVDTEGTYNIDIAVTDATPRVTSRPLKLIVLPKMRLTRPAVYVAKQRINNTSSATTADYVIGTDVVFAKGSGNWPEGMDVNPATGAIIGEPIVAAGDYPGLTIVATNTFGNGFIDNATSNEFTITVQADMTLPTIADDADIYASTSQPVNYAPRVTNGAISDTFEMSGTLPLGLNFNPDTGAITGTPQQAGVFEIAITVISINGLTDTAKPFKFRVRDENNPLSATSSGGGGLTIVYTGITARIPLTFTNAIGDVEVYVQGSGHSFYSNETNYDENTNELIIRTSKDNRGNIAIEYRDEVTESVKRIYMSLLSVEFRTEYNTVNAVVGEVFTSDPFQSYNYLDRSPYTEYQNAYLNYTGNVTYEYQGLPDEFTYDANTGIISSNSPAEAGDYTITATTTSAEGDVHTGEFWLIVTSPEDQYAYWRFSFDINRYLYSSVEIGQIQFLDISGDSLSTDKFTSATASVGEFDNSVGAIFNKYWYSGGLYCPYGLYNWKSCNVSGEAITSISLTFQLSEAINPIKMQTIEDDTYNLFYRYPFTIEKSKDGITWYNQNYTRSSSIRNLGREHIGSIYTLTD